MREECRDPVDTRLLNIVLDNARRVERIVADVLDLGRRDRLHREPIDLRQALPNLVDEYTLKESVAAGMVRLDFRGLASLFFDRSHFYQVMWNLLGNALRHSSGGAGSVLIRVHDGLRDGGVELHVINDGEGIDEGLREHVFEPFFTTRSNGTGLGLYIARELCEANGARLDLLNSETGTDFCITGRAVE